MGAHNTQHNGGIYGGQIAIVSLAASEHNRQLERFRECFNGMMELLLILVTASLSSAAPAALAAGACVPYMYILAI